MKELFEQKGRSLAILRHSLSTISLLSHISLQALTRSILTRDSDPRAPGLPLPRHSCVFITLSPSQSPESTFRHINKIMFYYLPLKTEMAPLRGP